MSQWSEALILKWNQDLPKVRKVGKVARHAGHGDATLYLWPCED